VAIALVWPSLAHVAPSPRMAHLAPDVVRQGRVAILTLSASVPMTRFVVRFAGRSWPLYRDGPMTWQTIIGTDPTTPAGRHTVTIEATTGGEAKVVMKRPITVARVAFAQRRITFDPDRNALLTKENVERERRLVGAALRVLHQEKLWEGMFAFPVPGGVSSPYGVLSIYQGVVRGFHSGADFPVPQGTPVRATNHGTVRLAAALPLSGNAVMIDHGLGVVTSYLHLSALSVTAGQRVMKGDVIGAVGSTGLATGPHLHWGLRVNGIRVDPVPWAAR
jgi:murein DD-endopeptidase MepM/ murein hydrolase activator NlpD